MSVEQNIVLGLLQIQSYGMKKTTEYWRPINRNSVLIPMLRTISTKHYLHRTNTFQSFPSLTSINSVPNNLPAIKSDLIGFLKYWKFRPIITIICSDIQVLCYVVAGPIWYWPIPSIFLFLLLLLLLLLGQSAISLKLKEIKQLDNNPNGSY